MIDHIHALAERYQALRYAAWGKGATPLVRKELADAIASAQEAYLAWSQSFDSVTGAASDYEPWVQRAQKLAAELAKVGKPLPDWQAPPSLAAQQVQTAVTFTTDTILPWAVAVGFGYWLLTRK